MDLSKTDITKIDKQLQDRLRQSRGDEVLRVAIILVPDPRFEKNLNLPHLDPSQFPSRTDYRKALIEQQQIYLEANLANIIQELRKLSLNINGGMTSRVIIAEGTAQQILNSLELPEVYHASLDREIKIIPPPLSEEDLEAAKYLTEIALTIFESFKDSLDKVPSQKLIYQSFEAYVENYKTRYCLVQVLGMREPINLDSVYTGVKFLDDEAIRSFDSIENLEKLYRQAKSLRFQSQHKRKQEGIEVANEEQYLMVLGEPGTGKSTFLQKMGLEALKGQGGGFKHTCIPIFIELKIITSGEINIENFIAEKFRSCEVPEPEKFLTEALEQGKLLILFDGLDEVPTENLNNIINHIQDFVNKYDKNRFIASCRTAAYRSNFQGFSDVVMADFDDTQIRKFIDNWFQSAADKQAQTGEKCWELLQKPENSAAKELAHTPLLLTFLCLVYDRSQNFPNNRSLLYGKALRILLEEWASEKRILQNEIYQGFNTDLEEMLLSEIAYTGFKSDRLFFSGDEIVEQIKTFLANNLNAPQHLNGKAILNAITIQQGILVERAENIFSFSHLTLQEYLTAQYINDHHQTEELVSKYLTDERWKEVFLLVFGLMKVGADNLLDLMEKEAQKYIKTPKLQAVLNWAEQITTGSAGDLKPLVKRAVAISIVYTFARTISGSYVSSDNANVKAIINISNVKAIANVEAYAIIISMAKIIIDIKKDINDKSITTKLLTTLLRMDKIKSKFNIIVNFIDMAINSSHALEESKIFNKVNFSVLIDELNLLKNKIPDEKQTLAVYQEFFQHLQQALLNAFNLSLDVVNLSDQEKKALGNYLYVNNLLIKCKQASVRISPSTWEAIEARMLLIESKL
jgi:hypothetical protein